MVLFDFLKTEQQKINERVPGALARLEHLIEICGPEAGPMAALRSLAKDADLIRGGRVRGLVENSGDEFGIWAGKTAKELELDWWADRASYMGMKDGGWIEGGPDVPGLWTSEMKEFIKQYRPRVEDEEVED